jgi:hypothetical protein
MRFSTQQHPLYCGIDLPARTLYVCILSQDGEMVLHRTRPARPDAWLKAMAPYRDDIGIAIAGLLTWYWLAALCADQEIPFVLGHALSRKAIHGGKATHDTLDSQTIAALLRGGLWPPADVAPAAMRATRDLRRRRLHRRRPRAARLAHIHQTNRQDILPARGQKIAAKANRAGVAEPFPAPAVPKRGAVDGARSAHSAPLLRNLERSLLPPAQPHHATTLSLLRTGPGMGARLSVVLRSAIPERPRFPRGPEGVSDGRLGPWVRASAGTRYGTAGATLGTAALKGACATAAVVFRRHQPAGPQ